MTEIDAHNGAEAFSTECELFTVTETGKKVIIHHEEAA